MFARSESGNAKRYVTYMADTQNEKEDARQWFLRINGETVFGPVSTEGLIVWAEQGRILPGHEVSTDRKKWVQAVSVPLLDMRWFVDDGEGELRGPLNRLAAEALLKSGKVPEGAQLVSADEVEANTGAERGEAKSEEKPNEPLPDAVLRVRVRELEGMVNGLRERLAKLSDANTLETVQHERDVLSSLVKEVEGERDLLARNAEKDARAHERKEEFAKQQVKKLEQQVEEASNRLRLAETALSEQAAGFDRRLAEVEAAGVARVAELERRVAEAESRYCTTEKAFAELLNDANARDAAYQEKIAALEKACAQSPEEIARFFADQSAVFELMKAEADELAEGMERERKFIDQLKEWGGQRRQALLERRQALLKQMGSSPVDMTRRAAREQPSDPNAARVRAELDNLRIAHQRELRQAEEVERDMQRKLRVLEAESGKLLGQVVEGEKMERRVQELTESLRKREQELSDERKSRELEREQYQSSQQALMMRIETLEKASRPTTPDEIQSAEARTVKLASWMRLKR